MKLVYIVLVVLISLPLPVWVSAANLTPPALMLAKNYSPSADLSQFLVSEKLDGVRAYWDGRSLRTRSGRSINAPAWFLSGLPPEPLDGELWAGRGRFDKVSAAVRRSSGGEEAWQEIRFMLFDLPQAAGGFSDRYQQLSEVVARSGVGHLAVIEHRSVASSEELQQWLHDLVQQGGEGLMLRQLDAPYSRGRSSGMLKLKQYQDAEGVVIAHLPGKGRLEGKLGALLIKLPDGRKLKLGSGLSDQERSQPPALGSVVTYRYNGLTSGGLPRFARYLRIRHSTLD